MHELKELNKLVLHNGGMVSYLENHNALNEEPSLPYNYFTTKFSCLLPMRFIPHIKHRHFWV
jgi:hypothetical protein